MAENIADHLGLGDGSDHLQRPLRAKNGQVAIFRANTLFRSLA
jgi:hypothetical protein